MDSGVGAQIRMNRHSQKSTNGPCAGAPETTRGCPMFGLPPRVLVILLAILWLAAATQTLGTVGHRIPVTQDDALQRGLNALKENHFDQALAALAIAENEQPGDPRVRNFRGIALAQLGKPAEAELEYREAVRLDPKFEDAWRNLGYLEWTRHRPEEAREALLKAIALSPEDSFAHYYLGRLEMEAGQYNDAFRELSLSRLPWPEDTEFLIQVARGYVALGKQQEAQKILRQVATQPLRASESARVASLLLAVRDYGATIALLKSASTRGAPDDVAWARFDLALTYLQAGNYEQSVQETRSYIDQQHAREPSSAMAPGWSLLGITEARLGHSEPAEVALRQAAALDPGNEEHWLNLTRELMATSQYAEAISATQQGIAANPKSYALQLRLGAAQLAAGRYQQAEGVFRTLVEAGDPLPTSYIGLAQVLLREGRAEDATNILTAAEQKIGDNFLLSYFLGLALDRTGKKREAAQAFRKALQLSPGSSQAHLGLGKSQLALGQVKQAIAELQEALRLDPGNVPARRLLSQAYRRAGDSKLAQELAESSSEGPALPEGDLLEDFFLAKWQMPQEKEKNR